jgi:hypothetical protein
MSTLVNVLRIDVASLKAGFLYHSSNANGYSFRNKIFANNAKMNAMGVCFPHLQIL